MNKLQRQYSLKMNLLNLLNNIIVDNKKGEIKNDRKIIEKSQ